MEILPGLRNTTSILLARAGHYDPDAELEDAERAGAWVAWKKAVTGQSPQSIVRLIGEAGLTGRGGAGYPTAAKWRACAADCPTSTLG